MKNVKSIISNSGVDVVGGNLGEKRNVIISCQKTLEFQLQVAMLISHQKRTVTNLNGTRIIEEIVEAAEIAIKYHGYIAREEAIAQKLSRLEHVQIRGKFDYASIQSLSTEARQKLAKIDPETVGQASRIPGISPSDVNILLLLLGR